MICFHILHKREYIQNSHMLPLSFLCPHSIIYGAPAGRLCVAVLIANTDKNITQEIIFLCSYIVHMTTHSWLTEVDKL